MIVHMSGRCYSLCNGRLDGLSLDRWEELPDMLMKRIH